MDLTGFGTIRGVSWRHNLFSTFFLLLDQLHPLPPSLIIQHPTMISNDFVINTDKLSLVQVTKQNINMLRSLNSVLFPITYSETFYTLLLIPSTERVIRIGINSVISYY